jgi:hypothetical protein
MVSCRRRRGLPAQVLGMRHPPASRSRRCQTDFCTQLRRHAGEEERLKIVFVLEIAFGDSLQSSELTR